MHSRAQRSTPNTYEIGEFLWSGERSVDNGFPSLGTQTFQVVYMGVGEEKGETSCIETDFGSRRVQ